MQTEPCSAEDCKTDEQFRRYVAYALKAGEERMNRMEAAIKGNTDKLDQSASKTDRMFDAFTKMEGGFVVLEYLAKGLKWGAIVVGSTAAIFKALGWKWPWQ